MEQPTWRVKSRAKEKEKAQANIAAGYCRNHAGVVPLPGTTLCKYCSDLRAEQKAKNNKNGKCRNHANVDVKPGRTMCQECLDASTERARKRRERKVCENHPDRPLNRGSRGCDECMENNLWKRIKSIYKLTKEQYLFECEKRNYKCDICSIDCLSIGSGIQNKKQIYHIDHDHETGKLRGLICASCNAVLGMLKNKKNDKLDKFIENAPDYLKNAEIKIR